MFDETLFINEISKIEKKDDGSYIVIRNNIPCHIPYNDEYRQEYNAVEEYIKKNNIKVNTHIQKVYKIIDDNMEENIRSKRDELLKQADIMLMKYQEQVYLNVPHMKLPCDIWRRNHNRERFFAPVHLGMEIFLFHPFLINLIFDSFWVVSLC